MIIKDVLRDVVNTTSTIGFDVIVVSKTDDNFMSLEAVTTDKRVIMKAQVKEEVTDLVDADTFGIGTLGMLQGLLNLTTFKTDSAKITPVINNGVVTKLSFTSDDASTDFILLAKNALPRQPKFLNKPFDVQVIPSAAKVQELKGYAGVFKSISENVVPYTENNQLCFKVGNTGKANHSGSISFGPCTGTLSEKYSYSVERIMQCLTRINSCKECSINITESGALAVKIDTGVTVFNLFILGS